ncbi:RIC1-domain-containing protein [Tilletiaria anomala UBC 951]|uniref:RIC1-domain-containing protein n=1 Tax=Tilletiaria anomala (strain ATCC 24038 / CBS 436.72 / UBC 951) TaxID=1037660 RepID=A0A066VFS2_TILAU|nr:RIC1-domain-containing protein [Tilletiaria anomala UBC 951]KDN39153.1 RIC1-domain-containing protein [Tilletiaria anomala UBC 951]
MYWPVFSARRLHLSPAGLHQLPPATEEEAAAAQVLAQANGPPTAATTSGFPLEVPNGAGPSSAGPSASFGRSFQNCAQDGGGPEDQEELVDVARSRNGAHWISLSPYTIAVWSTRPSQVIAALRRTRKSVDEYGENVKVQWRPNGLGLVIETSKSFLLLYNVSFLTPAIFSYVPPSGTGAKSATSNELFTPTPAALQAVFHLSPGEHASVKYGDGSPAGTRGRGNLNGMENGAGNSGSSNAEMCELRFSMALKIDAGLGCCAPTESQLIVATLNPPAVQAIPWPDAPSSISGAAKRQALAAGKSRASIEEAERQAQPATRTSLISRLDWIQLSAVSRESNASLNGSSSASASTSTSVPAADEDTDPPGLQEATHPQEVYVRQIEHSRAMDLFVWITSDGRAHAAHLDVDANCSSGFWEGRSFHGLQRLQLRRRASGVSVAGPEESSKQRQTSFSDLKAGKLDIKGKQPALDAEVPEEKRAVQSAVNARFSLIAIGLQDGTVAIYSYRSPDRVPLQTHILSLRQSYKSTASYLTTGPVTSLSWTSDGHALAVAWENGWAVWSTYGKLMGCSLRESWTGMHKKFMDTFLFGAKRLFWGLGNTELYFLARKKEDRAFDPDNQLFVLPFAKSTIAGQHSPDNTRYAFVQLDDSLLVYRGSDQPDVSIINPESDIWHHIKIPQAYIASNWPIRYACISSDGKLIAVAGRRGLAHYSTVSGRWKTYTKLQQEQSFAIRGGMQWFHHVLLAACDFGDEYQIRMYSRDLELENSQLLHLERVSSPVLLTSLFEDSLLVYTADNTFYHYLITTTTDSIRLKLCGSITFDGVVGEPSRVRGMSWMVPPSQQEFGDPIDDLTVAAIIFLIDGKLILLRPRRLGQDEEEVAYDMQVLADQIEFYWTHLKGIGGLENSLWGYDGNSVKVWLNALALDQPRRIAISNSEMDDSEGPSDAEDEGQHDGYKTIEESVTLGLDFYPLCVLMEKGIIIGVDPDMSLRKTLDFVIFRSSTNTHLFLQQVLRNLLKKRHVRHAVAFASHYSQLVYFAHAMEILLHDVLEDEADAEGLKSLPAGTDGNRGTDENAKRLLPLVIDFLDHFDDALRVVVNCARKTELTRWGYLFSYAGNPTDLFEKCLERDELRVAASYLLVLHSLESVEESTVMTVRLLRRAASKKKWALCKDLLRFLRSVDDTGDMVRNAIVQAGLLEGTSADVTTSTLNMDNEHCIEGVTPRAATSSRMGSPSIVIDPAPLLQRSTSAPNALDPTLEEEEEPDDGQTVLDYGSPRENSLFGDTVLLHPSAADSHLKGSPSKSKRISVQRRVSVPIVQSSNENPSTNSPVSGFGMSLSRVGLRSSDRLVSPQQVRSLLSPNMGPGRSNSPHPVTSASPTRTVEEFVIE